ncbi:MAG: elongation factor G, partial [Planctomycetota bacterium]
VTVRLEPDKTSVRPIIQNLAGDKIPKQFILPIEDTLKTTVLSGPIAGYSLIYMRITITGGAYQQLKSSETAFSAAASLAFNDALKKNKSIILEPIMKFEIITPEKNLGDIINDLNKRRGIIEAIDSLGQMRRIHGKIPIAETFGYASAMRSLTSGLGSYSLEPADYQPR